MDDANVPLHQKVDGNREQEQEKGEGDQRREGTWDLFREYLRDTFNKDSYESFAHAWHKAAAPDTTASLLISLALSLSGSLAGIFILIGRIFHPDWDQALWFIGVHLSCGLAIILLTESDRVEPRFSKRTKLEKGVRWIAKWFFMSFYLWRIKRSLDNFFRKTRIKRKANKAFKGRQTAYVAQLEIKTASESRLIYVKESDLDRLENSVRGFSLAALSIYFYMYSDRCKSMAWFSRDAQTFGTLLWCLVTTSWASTAFEQRYHEYAYIFHFYDRVYRRYSRLSMTEAILIFCSHFLRLVSKLHIIGYLICLSYTSAIWATLWQPLWSFISHHFLYYLGLYHLPPLLHFKNFKRFLFLDHLVSSSPVTLLCSLGKKQYSHPAPRKERETSDGSLLSTLKTFWEETPKRLGVIVFVNDLLPLLLSQACLSTIATHMRPVQSPPGFSVNCTNVDAWNFTFLPDFAEPSSALVLFIPPRDWRKLAAGSLGDALGFGLLALYAVALLVYALHVRFRVNRRSGFPRAVRRSIWRKILTVKKKPGDRIRILMVLFHLNYEERQKFLLKLLSSTAPGNLDDKMKKLFGNNWENRDDIIKDRLTKLNFADEAISKEEIICSSEDSEFKEQLQKLKEQVFPLPESDENLRHLVVAFFTEPLEQRFDNVDDRDLLLVLDLLKVSMKDALTQPESRFGGQADLYNVSKGKKYALIISNTFPTLKLALPKNQTLCTQHIGIGPGDNTDMKRMATLLKSLSFEVDCKYNLTKWKLFKTLERFRNKVHEEGGALAFVVVMSSVGFDSSFGILTADCDEVDHEDIMCGFDEAGHLAGVPKVFLFNVCVNSWTPELSFYAGWNKKYGKLSSKNRRELVMRNSFRYQVLPDSKFRYKKSRRLIQDLKDTLLILPTPYFVTFREPCAASQFLRKLERTIPSPGFRFTLMELLSRVTPAVTPYSFRDLELERNFGE